MSPRPLLALAALCTACSISSPPVRWYTLRSDTEARLGEAQVDADAEVSLGVGPIELPDPLERPHIVTRVAPHRVEAAEHHRWAGGFHQELGATIAAEIAESAGAAGPIRVAAMPWPAWFAPTHRVAVDVSRFDGTLGGEIVLEARWALTGASVRQLIAVRHVRIVEPVDGADFTAYVAAMERAARALAREIAAEVPR